MENCLYGGLTLVGLFNHQSEKSVQTEPTFLETYFVKDFFDSNKPNLCFERFSVRNEPITKNDRAMIEDFLQKNDSNCNSLELAHFEEQFIKAHLNNLKPQEQQTNSGAVILNQVANEKKDIKPEKQKTIIANPKYIKVDLKERRYKCETCNKRFVNSSDFKRHLKIHTEEKLFVCTVCSKGELTFN